MAAMPIYGKTTTTFFCPVIVYFYSQVSDGCHITKYSAASNAFAIKESSRVCSCHLRPILSRGLTAQLFPTIIYQQKMWKQKLLFIVTRSKQTNEAFVTQCSLSNFNNVHRTVSETEL